MDIATGVALAALFAILAMGAFLYLQHLAVRAIERRLSELASPDVHLARFTPSPDVVENLVQGEPNSLDVVGAWAAEQRRMGREVTDADMDVQRRMWASEGV